MTFPLSFSACALLAALVATTHANAAFEASFDSGQPIAKVAPNQAGGWSWYSGDGDATVSFLPGPGYATMQVDARQDTLNIWWAVIRSRVSGSLDLSELARPDRELRIEARVRVSHAPRRINLQLSSSRSFQDGPHSHLREFDIPVAGQWREISMTTVGFPAEPGDAIYCQLAMIDWGKELYSTDIDYIKVSLVDPARAGPDHGQPLVYHPPLPEPEELEVTAPASADVVIDALNPKMNLHLWGSPQDRAMIPSLLPVTPSQTALLRWDLSPHRGQKAQGTAVLELTTQSLTRLLGDYEEIGRLRVVEILESSPDWEERTVTFASFTRGGELTAATNPQPVIDVQIDPRPGARNRIAIPQPVMQRLIDGASRGLALRALGPINATFYSRESATDAHAPTLQFSLDQNP